MSEVAPIVFLVDDDHLRAVERRSGFLVLAQAVLRHGPYRESARVDLVAVSVGGEAL